MYLIGYSEEVKKQLKKMDKNTSRLIKNWIVKNLIDVEDPRIKGKPLKGNLQGIWRYRVGDYRLLAEIRDKELLIFIFEVDHRSKIY